MNVTEVDERIKVGAVFDGSAVTPKWFFRGKEKHAVKKVEQIWKSKEGESPLLFFTVNDGSNIYEIRLNQKSLEWRLKKVYMEG